MIFRHHTDERLVRLLILVFGHLVSLHSFKIIRNSTCIYINLVNITSQVILRNPIFTAVMFVVFVTIFVFFNEGFAILPENFATCVENLSSSVWFSGVCLFSSLKTVLNWEPSSPASSL